MLLIFHLNDGHKIAAVGCKQLCHVIHAKQDGCLWGTCVCVGTYRRMSEVEVRACVCVCGLPPEQFSIHASSLNHPSRCPLPGSDRGGSRDQLPSETCYYYHQRGGRPPSPALILISTETEGESGPFVSEMFIYAADYAKGHGKALITGHDSIEPQHMIHFLSFNLVVSLGKFV